MLATENPRRLCPAAGPAYPLPGFAVRQPRSGCAATNAESAINRHLIREHKSLREVVVLVVRLWPLSAKPPECARNACVGEHARTGADPAEHASSGDQESELRGAAAAPRVLASLWSAARHTHTPCLHSSLPRSRFKDLPAFDLGKFEWEMACQEFFRAGDIVSLRFVEYVFSGGAHGNHQISTLNHFGDAPISQRIDQLIRTDDESAKAVFDLCRNQIIEYYSPTRRKSLSATTRISTTRGV